MNLTAEQREQVATELKRFAGDLNLNDEQKEKLHAALAATRIFSHFPSDALVSRPTSTHKLRQSL